MPFEPSLENFVWLQLGILVLGIGYMLWRPRRREGFTLKMEKLPPGQKKEQLSSSKVSIPSVDLKGNSESSRALQVFFNYNGHTFEAYEVLGLPAGSSFTKVEATFRSQIHSVDSESKAFLEAAFNALKASQN